MSGHSILFIDALRTLEQRFQWKLQFLLVCDHNRPIPVFKPSVLLTEELEPNVFHTVWPIPIAKRGKPKGSKNRGVGVGRGRGGAAARGRGRGGGRVGRGGRGRAIGDGADEPLALEDGEMEYDEAASESDLGSQPASSVADSKFEQAESEEDSYRFCFT